jgi:hypothetical protein
MILVYAGRRVDAGDRTSAERFPLASVSRVQRDVERVLRQLRPAAVVGSAACGSDLLVLEAAGRLRVRRRVIVPFEQSTFRATSVTDRPGNWGQRFDTVISAVIASGDLVELALDPKESGAYQKVNAQIFREAEGLAAGDEDAFAALVLWNGVTRGTGDMTEAFLNEARRRGWPITEIDTRKPVTGAE